MTKAHQKPDCPCASTHCPRHSDCNACRANHHAKGSKTACEKLNAQG